MKRFITAALTAALTICSVTHAYANEVGDRIFVATPKAPPIYTSKDGTKYWPCNGFVSPKLITIIYEDLKAISIAEGVPPPSDAICHYQIGTVKMMGNSITTYSVDFYTNKANMETCILRDHCTDFRNMMFKLKNDKLHRQYMVTNLNKKLNRMQCVEMTGNVANERGGC
jgi:hypothetical protein